MLIHLYGMPARRTGMGLGQLDPEHAVLVRSARLVRDYFGRQGNAALEGAVRALQDTVAALRAFALELFFALHRERRAVHFDVEVFLVQPRHFDVYHDTVVVFKQIPAQHGPGAGWDIEHIIDFRLGRQVGFLAGLESGQRIGRGLAQMLPTLAHRFPERRQALLKIFDFHCCLHRQAARVKRARHVLPVRVMQR